MSSRNVNKSRAEITKLYYLFHWKVTNIKLRKQNFNVGDQIFFAGVGVNVAGQGDQPSASGIGTGSAMISTEHDGRGGGHHTEVGPSGQVRH